MTHFWWPTVAHDIWSGVHGCAHCWLANNASHESQMQLQTLACDVPFDVVFLDIWSPGDIPDKDGSWKVLTCLDCMTGFANAVTLGKEISAKKLAFKAFASFFVPNGLP